MEACKYAKCGAEGQNRTVDTSLFRAVLYQLSYLGTVPESKKRGTVTGSSEKNQARAAFSTSSFAMAESGTFPPQSSLI